MIQRGKMKGFDEEEHIHTHINCTWIIIFSFKNLLKEKGRGLMKGNTHTHTHADYQ